MRIALATCAVLPEPDPDEAPAINALRAAGHDAHTLAWDDPTADPAEFDLIILRATWNYYHDAVAFLTWVDRAHASSRVLNSPKAVRWNIHKKYLCDLSRAGVPIVPTRYVATDEPADLAAILAETGWTDFVIKPAISAASYMTHRFSSDEFDAAQAFLDQIHGSRDAMVQRFLPRVATDCERSIMWIGGELTHVIRKQVRLHGQDESVDGGFEISSEERAIAEASLDALDPAIRDSLLYARIDVMPDDDGRLVLSELELIEPSLFFPHSDEAVERFVSAVEAAPASPA